MSFFFHQTEWNSDGTELGCGSVPNHFCQPMQAALSFEICRPEGRWPHDLWQWGGAPQDKESLPWSTVKFKLVLLFRLILFFLPQNVAFVPFQKWSIHVRWFINLCFHSKANSLKRKVRVFLKLCLLLSTTALCCVSWLMTPQLSVSWVSSMAAIPRGLHTYCIWPKSWTLTSWVSGELLFSILGAGWVLWRAYLGLVVCVFPPGFISLSENL